MSFSASAKVLAETVGPTDGAVPKAGGAPGVGSLGFAAPSDCRVESAQAAAISPREAADKKRRRDPMDSSAPTIAVYSMFVQQFLSSSNLLETIESEAQKNSREAKEFASLGLNAWNWRPSQTEWSIAECLAHLATSQAAFKPIVSRALERGRWLFHVSSHPAYQPTWMGAWLIRQVSLESLKKRLD
jgi:hypothetical protein